MPGPVVEVAFISTSDAYSRDPGLLESFSAKVAAVDGVLGYWNGLEVEDKTTLCTIVVWESLEHHQAFVAQEHFKELLNDLNKFIHGKPEFFHIPFDPSLVAAFDAPCTSFSRFLELKEGKSAQDLADIVSPTLHSAANVKGSHGGSFAKVLENDEHILVVGWDKPEDHTHGPAVNETLKTFVTRMRDVVGKYKGTHAKLEAYKKFRAQV